MARHGPAPAPFAHSFPFFLLFSLLLLLPTSVFAAGGSAGACTDSFPITPGAWSLITVPCDVTHLTGDNTTPSTFGVTTSSQIDTSLLPAPTIDPVMVSWQVYQDGFDPSSYDVTLQGPLGGTLPLHAFGSPDPTKMAVSLNFFATEGPGLYTLVVDFVTGAGSGVQIDQWWMDVLLDDTILGVFGDDLAPGDYGVRWGLFFLDPIKLTYSLAASNSPIVPGQGYWFKSLDAGTLTVTGTLASWDQVYAGQYPWSTPALVAASPPHPNLIGHPFQTAVPATTWDSVMVDGGTDPTTAETNGWITRYMYKWNGAGYDTWDASLGGAASGELYSWDAFWVKALTAGHWLDIPDPCGCCICLGRSRPGTTGGHAAHYRETEWAASLVAESGFLRDGRNLVGQLADATSGWDPHDTDEIEPFGDPHLTIVFPRPGWGREDVDFNADFRAAAAGCRGGSWPFEVRSSEVGSTVTLSWKNEANADDLLAGARLVDPTTGALLASGRDGSWSFVATEEPRRVVWMVAERRAAPTDCTRTTKEAQR